jgi:hypothetical protein
VSSIGLFVGDLAYKSCCGGSIGGAGLPLGSSLADSNMSFVGLHLNSWWERIDTSNLISRAMMTRPVEISITQYSVDISPDYPRRRHLLL